VDLCAGGGELKDLVIKGGETAIVGEADGTLIPATTNAANSSVRPSASPVWLARRTIARSGRFRSGSTPGPASAGSPSGCTAKASTCN
jgi:hypothetical protein